MTVSHEAVRIRCQFLRDMLKLTEYPEDMPALIDSVKAALDTWQTMDRMMQGPITALTLRAFMNSPVVEAMTELRLDLKEVVMGFGCIKPDPTPFERSIRALSDRLYDMVGV